MGFTVAYTLTVVNMAELAEDGLASSENEVKSCQLFPYLNLLPLPILVNRVAH